MIYRCKSIVFDDYDELNCNKPAFRFLICDSDVYFPVCNYCINDFLISEGYKEISEKEYLRLLKTKILK